MGYNNDKKHWSHVFSNMSKFNDKRHIVTCMYCGAPYEGEKSKCEVLDKKNNKET